MKRPNVLWIIALILGWSFDFLFWKHAPGISFAIYVVLCLAGGFLVLGLEGIKPAWRALLLLLPIGFFTAMTFIRQEPMSLFLAYAFTLGLMAVLAGTYLGGRWLWYGLVDYVAGFFRLVGSMVARPFVLLTETKKQAEAEAAAGAGGRGKGSGARRFWAILRGVLIALPIVAVFAALLSSADVVFAHRLDDFIKLLRLEKLPEYLFRGVYILIGAYLLVGVFLHAALRSRDEKLVGEDKPLVPAFLGFTEAAVILGAVEVLFAVFVVIQFRYFFGGQANISVEGYTYAEYARKGFGELVTVAFFSLLLFLGLSGIVKRETPAKRWSFSGLGIGMVVLIAVMLVSAFQRLMLYEAAYGFTRLRTYTHLFMFWLGGLLLAVVVLEVLRRERAFVFAVLLAGIGFAASLALLNVDAFIVRQNVDRAVRGEELDISYLASLSSDSLPVLAAEYRSASLPSGIRDALGASLACRARWTDDRAKPGWQSFTFSRWRGGIALDQVRQDLKAYTIQDEEWPYKVITPQRQEFECYPTGGSD